MSITYSYNTPDGKRVALTLDKPDPVAKKIYESGVTDRKFSLVTYMPIAEVDKFLRSAEWVQHWSYILHDKDKYPDDVKDKDGKVIHKKGDPKDPHIHVLLYTYHQKTSSAVRKRFEKYAREIAKKDGSTPQNTLADICDDVEAMYDYQCHIGEDPEIKVPYPTSDRVVDDPSYWAKYEKTSGLNDVIDNTGLAMVNDLLSGTSVYQMVEKYGKDYIYHKTHFDKVVSEIRWSDYRESAKAKKERIQKAEVDGAYAIINNLMDTMLLSPFNAEQQKQFCIMLEFALTQLKQDENIIFAIDTKSAEVVATSERI